MPARVHVTIKKAFDGYVAGQDAILSARGHEKMQQSTMSGHYDVRFTESDDGICKNPAGKEIEPPWKAREKAEASRNRAAAPEVTR